MKKEARIQSGGGPLELGRTVLGGISLLALALPAAAQGNDPYEDAWQRDAGRRTDQERVDRSDEQRRRDDTASRRTFVWDPATQRWVRSGEDRPEQDPWSDPGDPERDWGREQEPRYEWDASRDRWVPREADARGSRDVPRGSEPASGVPWGEEPQSTSTLTVTGTAQSYTKAAPAGGKQHTLIKVRLQDGRTNYVSLGPDVEPKDLDIEEGSRIVAQGRRGTIEGTQVLMASSVTVDGELTRVDAAAGGEGVGPQEPGSIAVHGTLADVRRFDVGDRMGEHTLIKVRTGDGLERVVDLGPEVSLADLGLERGDTLLVEGRRTRVDGRQVVAASSIEIGAPQDLERFRPASAYDGSSGRLRGRGSDFSQGVSVPERLELVVIELGPELAQELISSARYPSEEQPGHVVYRGTVESLRTASVEGVPEGHEVIEVRMKDGEEHVVDLGALLTRASLGLSPGDHVWFRGEERTIGGERVLQADTVRVCGRKRGL